MLVQAEASTSFITQSQSKDKLWLLRGSAPRPQQRSQDLHSAQSDNLGCELAIASPVFYIFLDRSGTGASEAPVHHAKLSQAPLV